MPSKAYAYVNGKFVLESEARVSIFDRGFLYGDGCFETMRVYGGRMFRAGEHLERLLAGLRVLGIEPLLSPEEFRAACRALIRYNAVEEGVARIYQTRDSFVVTVQPRRFVAPRGLQAILSSVRVGGRLSAYKTANRLPYILAQREAAAQEADEAVLLNTAGRVVEFTASNLFAVKDGVLWTPPLGDGALPGITRRAVLSLAREAGISTREESFGPEFLEAADEVFATNSLMEIAPVVSWGDQRKVTGQLQRAYRALVRAELNMPAA
jgi:branched-subunit amino acid aminotransferase/4-amino-4-deoxychorismate lyase